jgi:hypothetical protein
MSNQLPAPSDSPWWRPANAPTINGSPTKQSNSFFIIASLVIALIAGGVGATIGRTSSSNISGNFVSTEDAVERAPGSIANLACSSNSRSCINLRFRWRWFWNRFWIFLK